MEAKFYILYAEKFKMYTVTFSFLSNKFYENDKLLENIKKLFAF